MSMLTWVFVGCVCGGAASYMWRKGERSNWRINFLSGVIGAVFAGIFISPWFDIKTVNQRTFSLPSMLVSMGGAVGLLIIVYVVRRVRASAQ